MKNLALGIRYFAGDEEGASAVEYGLLVALIAVAVMVTVYWVGVEINKAFNTILECLKNSSCAL